MEYRSSKPISLKGHPTYNEKWLQQKISEDPSLLGLGDLVVKDVERRQSAGGRLDLLLADPEAATPTRYEVELQLGATDETHIIRTLEYWDLERRRYPQYDHIAVIVAEDITSRFLNVISLFNGFIPLIAIELRAITVGDLLTLHATKVVDVTILGGEEDDEELGQSADRGYWESARGTPSTVALADRMLELIRDEVDPGLTLKYNKHYIGLARDGVPDNFIAFRARKQHLVAEFRIPRSEELTARLEEAGLDQLEYNTHWRRYRLRLTSADIAAHQDVLRDLIRQASSVGGGSD